MPLATESSQSSSRDVAPVDPSGIDLDVEVLQVEGAIDSFQTPETKTIKTVEEAEWERERLQQLLKNQREGARKNLAVGILAFLGLEIGFLLIAAAANWLSIEETKELVAIILVPSVAIAGTVVGFYFSVIE